MSDFDGLTDDAAMLSEAAELIGDDNDRARELINRVLTSMDGRGAYWEESLQEMAAEANS